jgi:hypothetical protein
LIPLQPLGGNAWRVDALAAAASCYLSFPRVSRLPNTPLAGAETHSEGVLHVLKTLLEPLAKAIPSQRSCRTSLGVDKQASCYKKPVAEEFASRRAITAQGQGHKGNCVATKRIFAATSYMYCIVSLQRRKATQREGSLLPPDVPLAMQLHDFVYVFHSRP